MQVELPKKLINFAALSNCPIFVVGGFLRNSLAGLQLGVDIDICGPFSAKDVVKLVDAAKIIAVNNKLGTALIDFCGLKLEYTRFRCESYSSGGLHLPSKVDFTDSLTKDAKRRDFTVNSIYYDINKNKLVDPLNGISDIKTKTLKCHNPKKIFASDGLRIMRLVRLAAELNFKIDKKTFKYAQKNAHLLKDIAFSRKAAELDKIINSDQKYHFEKAHYKGLTLLNDLGLYKYILPSILKLNSVKTKNQTNLLCHSFLMAFFAPSDLRLAALMYNSVIYFYQNSNNNADVVQSELLLDVVNQLGQNGLKYSNKTVAKVVTLLKLQMEYIGKKPEELRIFVWESFDYIEMLSKLNIAYALASGQNYVCPLLKIKQQLINQNTPILLKDLKIDASHAIKAGLKGKQIGLTLKSLLRQCALNPKLNNKEWLLAQLNTLAATQHIP